MWVLAKKYSKTSNYEILRKILLENFNHTKGPIYIYLLYVDGFILGGLIRVTKTLAAWQHCWTEIFKVFRILRKFPTNLTQIYCKISTKFHAVLLHNFHRNSHSFVIEFPKKNLVVWLGYCHENHSVLLLN